MVKKLNFGAKQKKWLIGTIVVLGVLVGNMIISTIPVTLKSEDVTTERVHLVRDVSYNGGDVNRDWNTTVDITLRANNPFFSPIPDDFLVWTKENGYVVTGAGTYSLFHLFDTNRLVQGQQSFMIDQDMETEDIQLFVESEKTKAVEYTFSEINAQ